MSTTRSLITTILAGAALFAAAPVAHAEPNEGGTPSTPRNCGEPGDGGMEHGEVRIRRTRYERTTTTCNDGTRCETRKVKQGNGSWKTFKKCTSEAQAQHSADSAMQNSTASASQDG